MKKFFFRYTSLTKKKQHQPYRHNDTFSRRLHMDLPLLCGLFLLSSIGLIILYSASHQNYHLLTKQMIRLGIAFAIMFVFAQIPPVKWRLWAPWLYTVGLCLLIAVLLIGVIGKGAQRWLNFGFLRFQPSEIMKLAIPLMLAGYLHDKPLPPTKKQLAICTLFIIFPVLLTAKQPDLGTALMLLCAGGSVLIFAGLQWRYLLSLLLLFIISAPILWTTMHDYQKQRVLTFLYPERDPLGTGYHIIQSKIAIGSGGIFGKGLFNGSQAYLNYLPEHATDFIFAVWSEETGLIGCAFLLLIYLAIILRGLVISYDAQNTFARLLVSSLSLTFFFSIFINIGMVTGILPVVGLPLPLVSYGGTSMVALMASFGLIMSMQTHRQLLSK
jgi:rod shape determining protein RodA